MDYEEQGLKKPEFTLPTKKCSKSLIVKNCYGKLQWSQQWPVLTFSTLTLLNYMNPRYCKCRWQEIEIYFYPWVRPTTVFNINLSFYWIMSTNLWNRNLSGLHVLSPHHPMGHEQHHTHKSNPATTLNLEPHLIPPDHDPNHRCKYDLCSVFFNLFLFLFLNLALKFLVLVSIFIKN